VPLTHINQAARRHITRRLSLRQSRKNSSRSSSSVSLHPSPLPANDPYSISSSNAPATTIISAHPIPVPIQRDTLTSRLNPHHFHNPTNNHNLISASNAPATNLYPLSLSSSQSGALPLLKLSSTGTTTVPAPLQGLQAGEASSFLQKISQSTETLSGSRYLESLTLYTLYLRKKCKSLRCDL
jgi:hypothetical protein